MTGFCCAPTGLLFGPRRLLPLYKTLDFNYQGRYTNPPSR